MTTTNQHLHDRIMKHVQPLIDRHEREILAGVEQRLNDAMKPRDDQRRQIVATDDLGRIRSNNMTQPIRVSDPRDELYARMPEAVRAVRSPDIDHWSAEWLRAHVRGDQGEMRHATDKLEALTGQRALAEGSAGADGAISDGTAGTLIPRPLAAAIMVERNRASKARQLATIVPMSAQQTNIPTVGSFAAGMVAEGATQTAAEPTMGQVPLVARKMQCHAVITRETLADEAVGLVSILSQRAGQALGELEDVQAFSSNGSAPNWTARVIAGLTEEDEASSGVLGLVDVNTLYHALGQPYRDGAAWFTTSAILEALSNVRDLQGRPLYSGMHEAPRVVTDDMGAQGTIFGKPVYDVQLPANHFVFMNLRAGYAIGSRSSIEVQSTDAVSWATDSVNFRFTSRADGNVMDTDAGVFMAGITSADDS